jgi:hypothetical protein
MSVRINLLLFCFLISTYLLAQDDLLSELSKEGETTTYAIATFKGTRLVNGHSVETKPVGTLEFIFSHRFGTLNSGAYEFWGLDNSLVRLGLEYGISDRLGVGIGRSSEAKIYDAYLKYKALRQATGRSPVTITGLSSIAYRTYREDPELSSSQKLSYAFQVLIARKLSSAISFQIAPIFLHRNYVNTSIEVNDLLALGFGGRVKVTPSVAITGEYYARLNELENNPYNDAIGVGVDIETGGHVFQLVLTNTSGMVERAFIPETFNNFFDGDIHFGFNITRTFQLSRKR